MIFESVSRPAGRRTLLFKCPCVADEKHFASRNTKLTFDSTHTLFIKLISPVGEGELLFVGGTRGDAEGGGDVAREHGLVHLQSW